MYVAVGPLATVSGGWAWHFMSPPHRELKHAHDHKDIDLFVKPEAVATLVALLRQRGFEKVWTKYDRLPSTEDFRRYERRVEAGGVAMSVKVTIDLFVRDVPFVEAQGVRVVQPLFLLGQIVAEQFALALEECLRARGAMDPQVLLACAGEQRLEHVMGKLRIFGLVRNRQDIRFLACRNPQV